MVQLSDDVLELFSTADVLWGMQTPLRKSQFNTFSEQSLHKANFDGVAGALHAISILQDVYETGFSASAVILELCLSYAEANVSGLSHFGFQRCVWIAMQHMEKKDQTGQVLQSIEKMRQILCYELRTRKPDEGPSESAIKQLSASFGDFASDSKYRINSTLATDLAKVVITRKRVLDFVQLFSGLYLKTRLSKFSEGEQLFVFFRKKLNFMKSLANYPLIVADFRVTFAAILSAVCDGLLSCYKYWELLQLVMEIIDLVLLNDLHAKNKLETIARGLIRYNYWELVVAVTSNRGFLPNSEVYEQWKAANQRWKKLLVKSLKAMGASERQPHPIDYFNAFETLCPCIQFSCESEELALWQIPKMAPSSIVQPAGVSETPRQSRAVARLSIWWIQPALQCLQLLRNCKGMMDQLRGKSNVEIGRLCYVLLTKLNFTPSMELCVALYEFVCERIIELARIDQHSTVAFWQLIATWRLMGSFYSDRKSVICRQCGYYVQPNCMVCIMCYRAIIKCSYEGYEWISALDRQIQAIIQAKKITGWPGE